MKKFIEKIGLPRLIITLMFIGICIAAVVLKLRNATSDNVKVRYV